MSDDGADLGIGAETGMQAALGSEEAQTKPRMTDEEFTAMIENANDKAQTYDGTANYAAKLVLTFLREHPEHRDLKAEPEKIGDPDLYSIMKESGVPLEDLGLTGFMWGWAVNAARHILQMPPVPNPAIVIIKGY